MIETADNPQLERFKKHRDPLKAINAYLFEVWKEASRRSYKFNPGKVVPVELDEKIPVTRDQLTYELQHLLRKLRRRNPKKYEEVKHVKEVEPNPVFSVIEGEVEPYRPLCNSSIFSDILTYFTFYSQSLKFIFWKWILFLVLMRGFIHLWGRWIPE